jgi:DNA polymerase-3 subunit alpha
MHTRYVPLHLHTQYSLLDGAVRIDDLIEQARAFEIPALAMTDHGNLFGTIDFYKKVSKAGIKPIIGCEAYVASNSRFDRSEAKSGVNFHLILLCKNTEGYQNLIAMVSEAYLKGFYYKPRIDKDLLRSHSQGLIALSACLKGEVPYYLARNMTQKAHEAAQEYLEIFGADNFFIEIQANELVEQEKLNAQLIEFARRLNIGLVATNDTHYLKREDAKAHELLLCIQTGKTVNDIDRMKFTGTGLYLKSPDEMAAYFSHVPEALENTARIAELCNLEFTFGQFHLPQYPLPPEYPDYKTYVREIAQAGLARKIGENPPEAYINRLNEELSMIETMGFSPYFLVVWDFIRYARSKGIPVGPGRGSAAGSLAAFCLDITNIDPIKYNLLFERFLNPERISMPDIDVDFCRDRRGEVIDYVAERYGRDHVAQIITFGTMQAKAVIRDVGRAMDVPYAIVDKVAKLVPTLLGINLKNAMAMEPKLKEQYDSDAKIRELIDIALKLEGLTRHSSTHAAGIVISKEPLNKLVPLYKAPNDDAVVTQFTMEAIESLGLLKFDFLGLKTLTMIHKAEHFIHQKNKTKNGAPHDKTFSVNDIGLQDNETYQLLGAGKTNAVFQLESSGMKELLVRAKPTVFEDIIALLALYRPGPLGEGMDEEFIKRKKGATPIKYEHPMLESILKDTYGIILYQEQVMQVANKMANFSMGQADVLRKAMGKKQAAMMDKLKTKFIEGAQANRIKEEKSAKIFDLMASFAKYGFNKSHSAAYALITYQTAYLKAHYPVEFMAAVLSLEMGDTDKILKYIQECRDMGIKILSPDINESDNEFKVVEGAIRFGLEAIKGVGASAIETILVARKKEPFKNLVDFCERSKANKKVMENLLKAGAFSSMGKRSQLMAILDQAIEEASRAQKNKNSMQFSFFDIQQAVSIPLPAIDELDDETILKMEKESLGFYISGHPLNKFNDKLKRLSVVAITDLAEKNENADVVIVGVIQSSKVITTKKGDAMAYLTVEDQYGNAEIVCFPDVYKEASNLFNEDKPLIIAGQLENSEKGAKIRASKIVTIDEAVSNPAIVSVAPQSNQRYRRKNGNGQPKKQEFVPIVSKIEVVIDADKAKAEDIQRLKGIIMNHPGSCQLMFKIKTPDPSPHETTIVCMTSAEPTQRLKVEVEEALGAGTIFYG